MLIAAVIVVPYPSFAIRLIELPWAIRVRRNAYENVSSNLLFVWNMMSNFLPSCDFAH